jgi:glycosyltransferase involved in cell wall biosynthesis
VSSLDRPPHVWVIQSGEFLPIKGRKVRPMRSLLIGEALAAQGATVTRWGSTFEHSAKIFVSEPGYIEQIGGVEFRLLHGRGYSKNVSLRRILHQRDLARDFRTRHRDAPRPDAIVAALPTIDLADAATDLARQWGVPCFIDFRDLWPEAFLDVSPLPRGLTRLMITPLYAQARRTISRATGILPITSGFLDKALELAGRGRREADRIFLHAYRRPRLLDAEQRDAEAFWRGQGLKLDGSEAIFCYFGGMTNSIPFEPMLNGAAALPSHLRQRLRVVICGNGPMLPALAARGMKELVLPGFIDGPHIACLMQHAMAGLLPYPNRPDFALSYPNKVGEYFSAGLPILTSLQGDCGRLLSETGTGRSVEGSAGWTQAFITMLKDEERRAGMKANAAKLYAEMFDADRVYGDLADHVLKAARK